MKDLKKNSEKNDFEVIIDEILSAAEKDIQLLLDKNSKEKDDRKI